MSVNEIEKRILEEAEAEAAGIKAECDRALAQMEKEHAQKKSQMEAELLSAARQKANDVKRAILVPARLAARKALLEEKQNILSGLYDEIKKQKKLSDAELGMLREKSEIKAAEILYG